MLLVIVVLSSIKLVSHWLAELLRKSNYTSFSIRQRRLMEPMDSTPISSSLPEQKPEPVVVGHRYHCRMCRTQLFTDKEIVPHDTPEGKGSYKQMMRGAQSCTSFFLDPDATPWVAEESRANVAAAGGSTGNHEGELGNLDTIYCFHCNAKLGGRNWSGAQCSCGAWITPAFRIAASRVDEFPIIE